MWIPFKLIILVFQREMCSIQNVQHCIPLRSSPFKLFSNVFQINVPLRMFSVQHFIPGKSVSFKVFSIMIWREVLQSNCLALYPMENCVPFKLFSNVFQMDVFHSKCSALHSR
jgi:hypothetical protein